MTCIIEATRDPNLQTAETSSEADRPHSGFTLTRSEAFAIPSLSKIKSAHYFATKCQELHPGIPLIPLRREALGPQGRRTSPKSAPWVSVDGWWNGKHTGKELIRLLKGDPSLGVGLRLGRRGPGMPWLVDILVKKLQEARPALMRMFDHHELKCAATWRDEEGRHRLFVGDDRLERFGQVVAGTMKGVGGNPDYAGLEIRLGSDDPSTSVVVLPPTPLGDGRPGEATSRRRRATGRDEFTTLTDRFYADLGRFALATNLGADEPRTTSAAPRPAQSVEPSATRPKRSRKVVAPGGPEDRQCVETTVVDLRDQGSQGTPRPLDLEVLAAAITEEIRAGNASMSKGLEHFRRAGEMLHNAKLRIGHGGYEKFVREHFGNCLETANKYKRIFLGWSTVEEMRRANPASEPDLTLIEVLKRLAKPRKKSGMNEVKVTPEAIDETVPEASALITDLDLPIHFGRSGEAARTDHVDLWTVESQSDEVPPTVLMSLLVGDPSGPAMTGEADPAEELEVGDGRVGQCGATRSDSLAGVGIIEEDRPRAEDLISLLKRCPIRIRLQKAERRHFDADARVWLLLQPIADEIRARHRRAGREDGIFATLVGDFLLGKSPEEWNLCPRCSGAGMLVVGGKRCSQCSGQGYGMWE